MNRFFNAFIQKNQFDELFAHNITQKTIKVFLIQCFGILLTLISNFWIAGLLKASGYGQFSFLITIINLLSTFACLGFSGLLIRDLASYSSQNKYAEIKGLIRFSYFVSIVCAFLLFAGLALALYLDLLPFKIEIFTLINIGICILFATLLVVRQFTLQGLNYTSESQVVNSVIRYVIVIFLLFIFAEVFSIPLNTKEVIFINAISLVVSLVLIEFIMRKLIPAEINIAKPIFHSSTWLKAAFVLFAFKLMSTYLLSSEILLLGYMRTDEEVGLYSIARKVAGFVSFGLFAANIVLAPKVASMYAEGQLELLQVLVRRSIRWIFIFTIVVALILAAVAYPVFSFLGEEYEKSYIPLLIMMGGELLNVAFGPVALLLINCKQEKVANKIMLFTLVFNLLCNTILIHFFGYIGAAIGTTLSVIAWNLLMALAVRNKTGIKSWVW